MSSQNVINEQIEVDFLYEDSFNFFGQKFGLISFAEPKTDNI